MKLFRLFFFFSVAALSLPAQAQPVQLWQSVEYAKFISLRGPTIALDKFQNTYMLTNQIDERPLGGFTLVKYDTSGNLLWKQNSQPSFAGIFYGSFLVDSTGNVYVSENYDGDLPDYDADAILVKYAPNGTKQWASNYGLNQAGDSYIYYSEMDTANGRLITLGVNWHDTIPAENFLFVQAVDTSDGSLIWRTEIPGVFYPQNMRIQSDHIQLLSTRYKPGSKYFVNTLVDFAGGVIAQYEKPYSGYEIDCNYISKTGDVIFGNTAFGYNVTRVNVQGDTLWTYIHPMNSGTNRNWVDAVVEDTFLSVYATGALEIPGQDVEMTTSKINMNGELVWQDIFQSFDGDFADAGVNASAYQEGLAISGVTQFENSDIVGIIKLYDADNGLSKYDVRITNENVFVIDEAFFLKGKVFYVGEGYQSDINHMVAVTGCFSIPKISSTVNYVGPSNTINTFPNPAADFIYISDIDTGIFDKISVSDAQGNLIIDKKIEHNQEKILLIGLSSGFYTVCVQGKGVQVNRKIIKI